METHTDIDSGIEREYELAFVTATDEVISPIFAALKKYECSLAHQSEVTSISLAYEIEKHTTAFFGFCRFTAKPEVIKPLQDEFTANKEILRFLIITPPIKDPVRSVKPVGRSVAPAPQKADSTSGSGTAVSNEALEQRLEEISQ